MVIKVFQNRWPTTWLGALLLAMLTVSACSTVKPATAHPAHNVIVMVPDGCSQSIQTLARWFKAAPLNLDGLNSGSAKTFMANSVITGSAAAATAFATGHKTTARFLGIGPRTGDLLSGFEPTSPPYTPVASVLEAASLSGKATGLVATSRISHATPAAFASHVSDRGMDSTIMEQMVYHDIDVVFGGGAGYLLPKKSNYTTTFGDTWKGRRDDGENLLAVLKNRGYQFVDNQTDMASITHGPVWGLFDGNHMAPHMDRTAVSPTQPAIAAMTAKAIEILSQDPNGFFLLVEGSQVDWAGHAMDSGYMVNEFLAFDQAVGQALAFARKDGNTCVYIWPDHNSGGLSIGNYATYFAPRFPDENDIRPIYTRTTIADLVAPLKKMRISAFALAKKISDPDSADAIKEALSVHWGITATPKDIQAILSTKALKTDYKKTMGLAYAIAEVINRNHTIIGWSSHGHQGEDVPVWSFGPQRLVGTFDNTELAKRSAQALHVDLMQTTRQLFVDLAQVFPDFILDRSDKANPVVKIGTQIVLPVNKDILRIGKATHRLSGVVVHAPQAGHGSGKIFIPQDAVTLIAEALQK